MNWKPCILVPAMAAVTAPMVAHAQVYLSVEQAQQLMFPGAKLVHMAVSLTDAQGSELRAATGIWQPLQTGMIWHAPGDGWLVIDKVLGKHEMITYAVGLNDDGSVRQVEILEYNESYGHEVRDPAWRHQFVGKTTASPVRLNNDIRNISGATLSSKHITDGVRRILMFHAMALKARG